MGFGFMLGLGLAVAVLLGVPALIVCGGLAGTMAVGDALDEEFQREIERQQGR